MKDDFCVREFLKFFDFFADEFCLSENYRLCEKKIILKDECKSTNSLLMNLAKKKTPQDMHCFFAAAQTQTKGRGRLGRSFFSPRGTGVYFSIAIQLSNFFDPAFLSVSAAVAVCFCAKDLFGSNCAIKWVNDVYLNQKKVAGILTEGILSEKNCVQGAVVGIGINITNDKGIPEYLKEKVGALCKKSMGIPRTKIMAQVVAHFLKIISSEKKDFVLFEYRSRDFLFGKHLKIFSVSDGNDFFEGTAQGIADDFSLLVKLDDGSVRKLHSGEVTLHTEN